MAEVQTNTQTGELAQRFIEFVMMQAQNAALFLGQIPNPQTGEGEVNLDLARMFIDQLAMIQEKTRGNLGKEEEMVLRNTLTNLQMAFVEVSQNGPTAGSTRAEAPSENAAIAPEQPTVAATSEAAQPSATAPAEAATETESRKKFTKSYGA
jgi:Domain of unknown function (DUF1844)